MPTFRIINYPKTIEGCHDLINLLVERLNEKDCSILSASDKKFHIDSPPFSHAPAGINGENFNNNLNNGCGGVSFEGVEPYRPLSALATEVRGSTLGYPCTF